MSRHSSSVLPEPLRAAVLAALADLPDHLVRTFERRVERWLPDLRTAVEDVYADADRVVGRLLLVAARRFAERPADLHDLDERRVLEPDWFQAPDTLGYATYVDRYAGTLTGVGDRLDHLRDLGVTYLHLLPLLQPRPAPQDGGYAVQDPVFRPAQTVEGCYLNVVGLPLCEALSLLEQAGYPTRLKRDWQPPAGCKDCPLGQHREAAGV